MEILTKDEYEYADIRMTEDDPHLWVKTPKGIINVFVGYNGRLNVTLWSPCCETTSPVTYYKFVANTHPPPHREIATNKRL